MADREPLRQWQDKAVVGLGAVLFVSPWLLGFSSVDSAAWNAYILGAWITVWSLVGLVVHAYWPMFLIGFGCAWLILSQKILEFTDHTVAMVWVIAFGAVTGFIAMWGAVAQANRENA